MKLNHVYIALTPKQASDPRSILDDAKTVAKQFECWVGITIYGIEITVKPDSNAMDLFEIFCMKFEKKNKKEWNN